MIKLKTLKDIHNESIFEEEDYDEGYNLCKKDLKQLGLEWIYELDRLSRTWGFDNKEDNDKVAEFIPYQEVRGESSECRYSQVICWIMDVFCISGEDIEKYKKTVKP